MIVNDDDNLIKKNIQNEYDYSDIIPTIDLVMNLIEYCSNTYKILYKLFEEDEQINQNIEINNRIYYYKKNYSDLFQVSINTKDKFYSFKDYDELLNIKNNVIKNVLSLCIKINLNYKSGTKNEFINHENFFSITFKPYKIIFTRKSNFKNLAMDKIEDDINKILQSFPSVNTIFYQREKQNDEQYLVNNANDTNIEKCGYLVFVNTKSYDFINQMLENKEIINVVDDILDIANSSGYKLDLKEIALYTTEDYDEINDFINIDSLYKKYFERFNKIVVICNFENNYLSTCADRICNLASKYDKECSYIFAIPPKVGYALYDDYLQRSSELAKNIKKYSIDVQDIVDSYPDFLWSDVMQIVFTLLFLAAKQIETKPNINIKEALYKLCDNVKEQKENNNKENSSMNISDDMNEMK